MNVEIIKKRLIRTLETGENKDSISIIVPAYNEEKNLRPLVQKICKALKPTEKTIDFEIIIIDDNSADRTYTVASELSFSYPVKVYKKMGVRGKAQSLIEGFRYARFPVIAMIDADLQYSPAAIPKMADKIGKGYDIVVANRTERKTSFQRKLVSKGFAYFFGKLLHGFDCDVQSGLKVFRKEIVERVSLHPTPWTFDLEFLSKARDAGYIIGSFKIPFYERKEGKSNVNIIRTSYEIGLAAVKLKLAERSIIPFSKNILVREGKGFHYKGKRFVPHTDLRFLETAFQTTSGFQKMFLLLSIGLAAASFLVNWHTAGVLLVALLTFLYASDILFNLYLVKRSLGSKGAIDINDDELKSVNNFDWPRYTIFCPLYKEWEVLGQFINAIDKLDYPKDKLQVMLLLEEDDKQTIQKAREYELPPYFETVVVPHSHPKTKPKALNFGLRLAKGDYVVVYDAEDVPDPQQLKKAVLAFGRSDEKVICLQAKLNFFNPHQNILTKVFTAEYSLWFDLILTGLHSIGAPIPLGGTSNHFRIEPLRELRGWDAFNVTEDCDLGMRLFKTGYRTQMLESTTYEEANSSPVNWIRQRSRWIKGYIQTYFVHMRQLRSFKKQPLVHFFTFQLVVGGKIMSMFINPFMWVTTIVYFSMRPHLGHLIDSFYPGPVLYLGTLSLVFGNFLYLYYYMVGCARRGHYGLVKYAYLTPLYWLGMSVASWYAIYNLLVNPHYWAKTVHGLHLKKEAEKEKNTGFFTPAGMKVGGMRSLYGNQY